jgi:methylase of polypeptide subunit release factors
MNEIINLTSLYEKYIGTSNDISVCFNEHTYKPNMDWENDWLSYIFCAFRVLKDEYRRKYENILIIGSGSGADAIGAIKILSPNNITITDIMSETLPVIKTNVEKYAQNCNFEIIKSDLFENIPLQKYDLIYENLPIFHHPYWGRT